MTRQFDVFPNPSVGSRSAAPYVVTLQSEYAGDLQTVIVAPLYHRHAAEFLTHLTLLVNFQETELVASIPEMVALNRRRLGRTAGSLAAYEDDIRRALDRLFMGF